LPGAFVVNVSELLKVAPSGYMDATNHRAAIPPEQFSVPFFYNRS
jgi:isopenicillin N synthase-like dioxygenase